MGAERKRMRIQPRWSEEEPLEMICLMTLVERLSHVPQSWMSLYI